jgi:hypothetical protein
MRRRAQLPASIALCLGRLPADFERSREVGDRQKTRKVSVVDDERAIRRRRGKLCEGVDGRLVLSEQRDLIEPV